MAKALMLLQYALPSSSVTRQKSHDDVDTKTLAPSTPIGESFSVEVKLVICVLGIYSCYLSSGMLQESIVSYRSQRGDRFSATLFLMWVPCVVNAMLAYLAMLLNGRSGDELPQQLLATAGFAYISATALSIEALKYVNFPTRELGKSCKMIPVMLFGALFANKRYSFREYLCVALVTAGIITFNLSKTSSKSEDKETSAYGLCLLILSLVLDGITTSSQERLKAACKPTVHEMMFFMNTWALGILSAAAYLSGQWSEGLTFSLENPVIVSYILIYSIASACGQNFIFYTISNFSPLTCTTITTTRKFFTIIFSVIMFGHSIGANQWGGVLMVFAGIGFEVRSKYQKKRREKEAEKRQHEKARTSGVNRIL